LERLFLDTWMVGNPPSLAAPGVKVSGGSLILVSGAVAWDEKGNVVGKGDVRTQARQAFENLKKVYAQAGATLQDIIKLNVYLTDRSQRLPLVEVRREYLQHNPPSTTVVVAGLVEEALLVEIDAIAMIPTSAG
jgi:enamine deaminase RidA (YjgF/YER057c/UK114 family)